VSSILCNARYRCWLQIFCLLAGWEVETCKVMCVQFDEGWCRQILCILSCIVLAAVPQSGKPPKFAAISMYIRFIEFTHH